MKKILLSIAMLCMALSGRAETQDVCMGWPANYDGVMLQGFWWDGYEAAKWTALEAKASELSQYFDLIWIPNSGTVGGDYNATQGKSMGYDPCYWLHHNSYFGTEQELIHMIQTYKDLGVGIIEDVVINHKKGVSGWLDFAQESGVVGPTTGKAYTVKWNNETASEICCTDDCNYVPDGDYHTTGSYDTGDDFPGFRDLDHTSATTQKNVKVYLNFLLNELGYVGFRYDLVKGYGAGYIQEYNNSAMPQFSVGEYWDNQTNIQNWIMGTGNTSAAFDFPLKYKLNEAISGGDYSALAWKSFTYDPQFSQYSVTFADNHDSGREDHSKLVNNWSAANAFILASPGTPCVWYPHYLADPVNIRAMILARKACGITNMNKDVWKQEVTESGKGYRLANAGTNGSVYVQFGDATSEAAPNGFTLVAEGDAYKFYTDVFNFASMTVSPNVGFFTEETLDVTLTPVNAQTDMAWYSFNADGSNKNYINEAETITIGENTSLNSDITIYWGAKGADNKEHTGSATFTKRQLYEPSAQNGEECVFFETDANKVSIWAWNEETGVNYTNDIWDEKPTIDVPMGVNEAGKLIYKWDKPTNIDGSPTKIIFVTDDSQTDNLDYVNHGYYNASGIVYHLGTNTVKFDNSVGNWAKVYYYAWDNNKHAKAAWPGEEITTLTDGYYQVTLDGVYPNIIFNDGTDDGSLAGLNKTEDLVAVDGKVYALGSNTVSFDKNSTEWTTVYCYAYANETVQNNAWPGVAVEANSNGLCEVTLPAAYTYVIFNNGTMDAAVGVDKTGDLAVVDGMTYALGTNTISYNNSQSKWEEVYCHAYTADNKPRMAWPGERLVADENGMYVITLPDIFTGVVFSDGKGGVVGVSQTADLTIVNDMNYGLTENTVYYDNSDTQWEDVYYYAYTDNEVWKVAWPGEKLTANTSGSDNDLYEVSLIEGYTHVIFNNGNSGVGTNQTENLTVEDGKTYKMEVAEINRLRIAGTFTNWQNDAKDMNAGSNFTWTYSLDLSENTGNVEFKLIVNDNDWMGFNNFTITAPNGWAESVGNDANIKLNNSTTNYKTYLITATWTPSASATAGWSLKIEGVEPRYASPYTVAGMSEILGSYWNAEDSNNDMILGDDGTYYYLTKTASLTNGTNYEFKVVVNHGWKEAYPSSNYEFSVETTGLYEVSFYFHPSNNTVTNKTVLKDVLEIVDGEPFNAAGNFTVPVATYSRTFKNNWGTLCLPFEIKKSYDGVTFYQLGAVDTENKVLTFTEMTTPVAAGQPVVYKAEDGTDLFIYEEGDVAVSATTETVSMTTPDDVVWSLDGSFTKLTNFNPESLCLYYIANNKFWLGNNTTILAYRAYFTTTENLGDASVGAPYRIEVGDPEDIQVVEQEDGSVKVYYDLQGRRLSQARKGLVIVNGKLIFVK